MSRLAGERLSAEQGVGIVVPGIGRILHAGLPAPRPADAGNLIPGRGVACLARRDPESTNPGKREVLALRPTNRSQARLHGRDDALSREL